MKDCWLSVDGGGTKTELLLSAGDGTRLFRARSGPSSVKSVGEAAARENLRAGLRTLWERAGAGPEAVIHGVFGLSGCDTLRDERLLRDMIAAGNTGLKGPTGNGFYQYDDPVAARKERDSKIMKSIKFVNEQLN